MCWIRAWGVFCGPSHAAVTETLRPHPATFPCWPQQVGRVGAGGHGSRVLGAEQGQCSMEPSTWPVAPDWNPFLLLPALSISREDTETSRERG